MLWISTVRKCEKFVLLAKAPKIQFKKAIFYKNVIYSCDAKLKSSLSHDPSEIILICWFNSYFWETIIFCF